MILSGRRLGALWRAVSASRKAPIARGVVTCAGCGREARCILLEAQTRRTERSPHLILLELGDAGPQPQLDVDPGGEHANTE